MTDLREQLDATVANATAKWGMGGGTVTSIFGCLSSNELLVILGIATTIGGFIVNLYFQWKRDRRSEEEHKLTMQKLQREVNESDNK